MSGVTEHTTFYALLKGCAVLVRKAILLHGDGIFSVGKELKVVAAFERLAIWARKG